MFEVERQRGVRKSVTAFAVAVVSTSALSRCRGRRLVAISEQ
jgi:hypothetical protein